MARKVAIVFFIAVLFVFCASSFAFAANDNEFVPVSVPYPEGEDLAWLDSLRLSLRYSDDKSIIPISEYYEGFLWGMVPAENADREVEAFIAPEKNFTDSNDDYAFFVLGNLAAKGVINGNEKGEGLPYSNITRAEAVAMIIRLLGLEVGEVEKSGFEDVADNAWYADVVALAEDMGIVSSDKYFAPDRNVSREEFVTMSARALWKTGMQVERKDLTVSDLDSVYKFYDAEKISSWARGAYAVFGSFAPADMEEVITEASAVFPETRNFADPKRAATREEAAILLWRILDNYQVYPSHLAFEYGFDKEMPIIDGSTSTYPFTETVYRTLFSDGYKHPNKPISHSKSHVSYQRLINGEVDMLFAATYPASDILAMAKEKGVELELIPIAYDAMIFFTNADNPAEGLTKEQISNIYVNNSYSDWNEIGGPDARLYPYCRNNDSGSHAQMEKHFLNGNQIHEKIRNETTSISMSNVLTDVMSAQTEDPLGYGLGYSIYYYFNNMDLFYETNTYLKLLSIDGVFPTDETIADGSYPLSNNTYIVLRADTPKDAPARKMVEFMLSEIGQICVEEAGYGPLKTK